jgi:colanic acid/amylovoran biosynthesis glycosyltransferase
MVERPLHILIVGSRWPPETFIARLIKGLLACGLRITVATPTKPAEEWLQQPGFQWLFAPHWQGSGTWRLIQFIRLFLRSLLSAGVSGTKVTGIFTSAGHLPTRPIWHHWYRFLPFVGQKWDVIYFPWNSAAVHYLPLFDLGCPIVISCRGSQINVAPHDSQRADFVAGLKMTLAQATAVHCVSEAIKLEACKYGLEPRKAHVIYPAVNPDFFQPASQPKPVAASPFRIIMIGALRWVKGYEFALLAVKQLLNVVSVHLEIIGDGPEWQRVLYTIEDLGLQQVVQLYRQLSPERIRDELQQSHVFLLSSLSEGISNAALEAMSCELPVVTTDCGGMREVVTDGQEGFIVPIGDPPALARALRILGEDDQLRCQMGQAGRKRIKQAFTLQGQITQFEKLIHCAVQLKP